MFKGVRRDQKLLLLSTFIVGLASGAYLYLTVYAPEFGDGFLPDRPEEVEEEDVSIRAGQYGDCIGSGLTCPSYELNSDGVLFISPAVDVRTVEPVIRRSQQDDESIAVLYEALVSAPLDEYAVASTVDTCTHAPGDHYRYVVFVGSENFVLDTCRTSFPKDSKLAVLLQSLFEPPPVLE